MKLYGIDMLRVREHVIGKGSAITGLSLGTDGPGQSQFIITWRSFEFEPHPEGWQVVSSSNGFPQVQASEAPSPGWLAYFSAYQPPGGKSLGRILVSSAQLDQVMVIGRGIGGNNEGVFWDEAFLALHPTEQVDVLVLMTSRPDVMYRFTPERATEERLFVLHEEDEFLRISDPQVPRWRRFRPKEE